MDFSVDLTRTVAIAMVILVHCSSFPYSIPGDITPMVMVDWFASDIYASIGYLGVPLFIMLSGALLLNPAKADESMRDFYKKRFFRIGVPMIFWTILYFFWSFNVHGTPFNLDSLAQGLISGSYPLFWFLYLLVGLYLVTPMLRVFVAHVDRRKFGVLLALWFIGTTLTPIIHNFTSYHFNPLSFVVLDWVGYFLIGVYLLNTNVRSAIAYGGLFFGLLVAVVGEWFLTASLGESYTGFFHGYLNFNMIIASISLFILLTRVPQSRIENLSAPVKRVIKWVAQNTLPLFLVHIMVVETLQLGLLGFRFPFTNIFIVDVLYLAAVTFALSAAIIYPLKKIPYLASLIG